MNFFSLSKLSLKQLTKHKFSFIVGKVISFDVKNTKFDKFSQLHIKKSSSIINYFLS